MRAWLIVIVGGFLSGLLLILSLPPVGRGFLGWFCLVPLLWAVQQKGFLKGFVGGIFACVVGAVLSTTALVGPNVIEDSSIGWNIAGFLLFGLVIGGLAGAVGERKTMQILDVIAFSGLAILLEFVTFLKLPAHLGLTQWAEPSLLKVASFAGIWGVSWMVWFVNLIGIKRPPLAIGIGILMATVAAFEPRPHAPLVGASAEIVQSRKFGAHELLSLTQIFANPNGTVIIWPELSTGEDDASEIQSAIKNTTASDRVAIVRGYAHEMQEKRQNRAAAVTASGSSQPYNKRKPFSAEAIHTIAGKDAVVVPAVGQQIGINICFDSCYPNVLRETALKGATVIVLPTQDPVSPNGFIQGVHAAFTTFRAAELGVPIIRTDHSAYSMIVNAEGRVTTSLGLQQDAVRIGVLDRPHETFYRRAGDWFLWLAILMLGIWTVQQKRSSKAPDAVNRQDDNSKG